MKIHTLSDDKPLLSGLGTRALLIALVALYALGLQGCSGSGGDSSSLNSDFGPPQDNRYSGRSTAAELDGRNAAEFLKLTLPGYGTDIFDPTPPIAPDAPLRQYRDQAATSLGHVRDISSRIAHFPLRSVAHEQPTTTTERNSRRKVTYQDSANEACQGGGRMSATYREFDDRSSHTDITFERCSEFGMILNGRVLETYPADMYGAQNTYFYDLTLESAEKRLFIHGAIREEYDPNCAGMRETYNATIENLDTGIAYKSENLTYTEAVCYSGPDQPGDTVSGRVYHSSYGYVDIVTEQPLVESRRYWDDESVLTAGQVRLTGADGSKLVATFTGQYATFESNDSGQAYRSGYIGAITTELDSNGDGQNELSVVMLTDDFFRGAGNDLNDDDGDGIPNGWEVLYGLAIDNSSDAELDADGDGFSNLAEFTGLSDARDETLRPLVFDIGVTIESRYEAVEVGQSYDLEIVTEQLVADVEPYFDLVITKSGNVDWDEMNGCEINPADERQIICEGQFINAMVPPRFTPLASGTVEFTIQAAFANGTDIDLSNNQANFSTQAYPQVRDLRVSLDIFNEGVAVIGQESSFQFSVREYSEHDVPATITITYPPTLEVKEAGFQVGFYNIGSTLQPCTITTTITCEIEAPPANDETIVTITFLGKQEGIEDVHVDISSALPDIYNADNNTSLRYYVGQSTESIQNEIDLAEADATVTLPSGLFVGGINSRYKRLHLQGQGVDQTRIVIASPNRGYSPSLEMGQGGSISGIEFMRSNLNLRKTFTLENNRFSDGTQVEWSNFSVAEDQLVIVRGNQFIGSKIVPEGYIGLGNCSFLRIWTPINGRIENNIFDSLGDECDLSAAIYVIASPQVTPIATNNLIISNNTFLNYPIAISTPTIPDDGLFIIQNNIFKNIGDGINSWNSSGANGYKYAQIRNNLFFQTTTPFTDSDEQPLESSNIFSDPGFVNEAAGEYRLKAGSAAIDSATNSDAPLLDFDGQLRPVDGDLDGTAVSDIGAFEFQP